MTRKVWRSCAILRHIVASILPISGRPKRGIRGSRVVIEETGCDGGRGREESDEVVEVERKAEGTWRDFLDGIGAFDVVARPVRWAVGSC